MLSIDGKAQFSTIDLGQSSNIYTITRPETNQIAVLPDSGWIVFLHQQNTNLYGGGAAAKDILRYDMSMDNGKTWVTDIGPITSLASHDSDFPQLVFPNGSTDLVYICDGLQPKSSVTPPTSISIGHGFLEKTDNSPSFTEGYVGQQSFLPGVAGSLSSGLPNQLWTARASSSDGSVDSIKIEIWHGTYSAKFQSTSWALQTTMPYDDTPELGKPQPRSFNTAFSPSGQYGWISYLGDHNGPPGADYHPIFIKTTDGGKNWSQPVEVDVLSATYSQLGGLQSELQLGQLNRVSCSVESDLTVDGLGNPHLLVVLGKSFAAYSFLTSSMVLADITSTDGGMTWHVHRVDKIYTWKGEFGTPDMSGNLVEMYNYPQVSRDRSGAIIFYSWVDSDTATVGAAETNNLAPNLRIAGWNTTDNTSTCTHHISDQDFLWDGRVLFPQMAPEVIIDSGRYHLPIVIASLTNNDQNQPGQFHYVGQYSYLEPIDFISMDLVNHNSCLCKSSLTFDGQISSGMYKTNGSILIDDESTTSAIGTYLFIMEENVELAGTSIIKTGSNVEIRNINKCRD